MGPASGPVWALIAGGGTAGHVVPAVAIGRALLGRGHAAASIHFVGSRRGIEARLVPEAGFSVTLLPGRGIARRVTLDNLGAGAGLALALAQAVRLVARLRPAVVLSVGGYASVPCSLAAAQLRVPLVVHEQNAVPGAANRLAARFARAAAVSFEGTPLPRATVTGNPVRPEVLAVDRSPPGRAAAREQLGLPPDVRLLVAFGGSLGARTINDAVLGLVRSWSGRSRLAVRHVVGERDWELLSSQLPTPGPGELVYQPVRYENHMECVFAAADLAICRAGGTTVAELAVVGLPSILVPLPIAPNDHQTANARALVGAGGALIVPDRELTAERLAAEVDPLLGDERRLPAMATALATVARRDAADRVVDLLERHARP
jgi:UDP-N-acetylglucosamine--N-acetylmuramyl-(pentapeptide) pyrophosphoryl-undecaprenol N-acetylglucosamine transferase